MQLIKGEYVDDHCHRSGWPYALDCIREVCTENEELLLDDFCELSFFGLRRDMAKNPYKDPWIGIFHFPPDTPSWYETGHIWKLTDSGYFRESINNLVCAICMGPNLAEWISSNWSVETAVVRHPSENCKITWDVNDFLEKESHHLVQVGYYLRDSSAIFRVSVPSTFRKMWLKPARSIAHRNHDKCVHRFHTRNYSIADTTISNRLTDEHYDILLANSVVFLNLLGSVANNTIIECISRNTPVVVNRLPGTEFYLGNRYPLFYDEIDQVQALLTKERIIEAHNYLCGLDKGWLSGDIFASSILEIANTYS